MRRADHELYDYLIDGEYCHVLAHPQTGKTSLIANTSARLRDKGVAVAIVDLSQASSEEVSENPGRWYYSIAYRIIRDLRIRTDIQQWWKDRGGLTNQQRFREFFLEIVLAETSIPVLICLDRIEATISQPLAQDLFKTVRSCYDSRATEFQFQRLTFLLSGSASSNEIVPKIRDSVFEISRTIDLEDFNSKELLGLASGLGNLESNPQDVAQRVWHWTKGHPYLSQKVMRALSRRLNSSPNLSHIDELVRNQFLSRTSIDAEPHLSAIAELILRKDRSKSKRLSLYGRIRKGIEIMAGADRGAQHELVISGLISENKDRRLCIRNEIYAMVFDVSWVNQNLSFGFKGLTTSVCFILLLLSISIWYSEYLPRPYVRILSNPSSDYTSALTAHETLKNIPGYSILADRLLTGFISESTQQALNNSSSVFSRLSQSGSMVLVWPEDSKALGPIVV
ncbi:MAG: AAA-like domain-containing protein, partial [Pseudomonadota bacterium]|nr:AAA-like domain-containing protein [Pseudomonadota bacterium]